MDPLYDMAIKTSKYFNEENGFGKHKDSAISLLRQTVDMLNDFEIRHFLISGTLLGYVRHNDIIPWDDDMDLLVSDDLLVKLNNIAEKYNDTLTFMSKKNYKMVKVCLKNEVTEIPGHAFGWKDNIINKGKYYWPFVDMYTFEETASHIEFFNRKWGLDKFFPGNKVNFLGIDVFIPNDPGKFLRTNYGPNYMTILESSRHCHKKECRTDSVKVTASDVKMPPQKRPQERLIKGGCKMIPGYMTSLELETLKNMFSRYNSKNSIGVEIGSLHGRSSLEIANAIPDGQLYCIDAWSGFDSNNGQFTDEECLLNEFPPKGTLCTLPFFMENVKSCKNITPIKGNSPHVTKHWTTPVDFVFLDALHANPSDWDNISFWLPKIKPGGMLAGHDFYQDQKTFPDVYDNVRRLEKTIGQVSLSPNTTLWYFVV